MQKFTSVVSVMLKIGLAIAVLLLPSAFCSEDSGQSVDIKGVSTFCGVHEADHTNWLKECAYYFKKDDFAGDDQISYISSYTFKAKPSGLCTIAFSSAFKGMQWNSSIAAVFAATDLLDTSIDEIQSQLPPLELPSIVSFPKCARDVVKLVKYANKNHLQVSIKNSEHSYSGQSSVAKSVLLNMRDYPKYSETSVVSDCDQISSDHWAYSACQLTVARGLDALVRLGGGEGNDDLYRNIESWNWQEPRTKRYDLLAGGEGTIGVGGGWMAGGGLSIGLERQWGVGIDQVLEIEMVLPSGEHVRFGPTEWEIDSHYIYPQTTKVTGYCNDNVHFDESQWRWKACTTNHNFEDLWFAVRGGGGGTWGVVLSWHYQLHPQTKQYTADFAGKAEGAIRAACSTESMTQLRAAAADAADACDPDRMMQQVAGMWTDFLVDFFYNPAALNVSTDMSNGCGYTQAWLDFFGLTKPPTGQLACFFKDAKDTFIAAWIDYVPTSKYFPPKLAALNKSLYTAVLQEEVEFCLFLGGSFARAVVGSSVGASVCQNPKRWKCTTDTVDCIRSRNVMPAAMGTSFGPIGHFVSASPSSTWLPASWSALIPASLFVEEKEFMIDFFTKYQYFANPHVLGGNVARASDGMNALHISGYRDAAIQIVLAPGAGYPEPMTYEIWTQLQTRILQHLGVSSPTTATDFPGFSEINHQFGWAVTPLRSDWSKPCPLGYTEAERRAQCLSVQETFWDSATLQRLEAIKRGVDPKNLFSVRFGVGNEEVPGAVPAEYIDGAWVEP